MTKGSGNDMVIECLETAIIDLENIADYYLMEFGADSARKVYNQIRETIFRLSIFLFSGAPAKEDLLRKLGYKELYSSRFVAIYRVEREHQKIYIY